MALSLFAFPYKGEFAKHNNRKKLSKLICLTNIFLLESE
jgi:hypothetical protein